jgi:hypothetical protein
MNLDILPNRERLTARVTLSPAIFSQLARRCAFFARAAGRPLASTQERHLKVKIVFRTLILTIAVVCAFGAAAYAQDPDQPPPSTGVRRTRTNSIITMPA